MVLSLGMPFLRLKPVKLTLIENYVLHFVQRTLAAALDAGYYIKGSVLIKVWLSTLRALTVFFVSKQVARMPQTPSGLLAYRFISIADDL